MQSCPGHIHPTGIWHEPVCRADPAHRHSLLYMSACVWVFYFPNKKRHSLSYFLSRWTNVCATAIFAPPNRNLVAAHNELKKKKKNDLCGSQQRFNWKKQTCWELTDGGVPCSLQPSLERLCSQSLDIGVRSASLYHEKFMRVKVCLAEMLQIEITASSLRQTVTAAEWDESAAEVA